MKVKKEFLEVMFKDVELQNGQAAQLRGYFATEGQENDILHNHAKTGENIYRYPRVQYKIYHKHPFLIAYEEGKECVSRVLESHDKLKIGSASFPMGDISIDYVEKTVGDAGETISYSFVTPWIALNQENYKKYKNFSPEEQQELLKKILIGNILSLSKGVGVTIENELQVEIDLQEMMVFYKGQRMLGFLGDFKVNCYLPLLCGLGKGSARGFGTIDAKQKV